MSAQSWVETLIASEVAGSALASSTSQTSLLPAAAKIVLPSRFFTVGKQVRVRAGGKVSNVVTTPGTLTFDIELGGTVIATTGAFTLNTTAMTNLPWELDWLLTCRAEGASATVIQSGTWRSHSVIGSPAPTAGGAGVHMIPYNTAPVVGNTFDSMAAAVLDLLGTWSVSSASNTITCETYTVECLN